MPQRGSLVDDDTFSPPKISIDNDGSDKVVESSNMPLEQRDSATNVNNDAAVQSVSLDELFDYDDISVQSVQDKELDSQCHKLDMGQET